MLGGLGEGSTQSLGYSQKYPPKAHVKGALIARGSDARPRNSIRAVTGLSHTYFKRRGADLEENSQLRFVCTDKYETVER